MLIFGVVRCANVGRRAERDLGNHIPSRRGPTTHACCLLFRSVFPTSYDRSGGWNVRPRHGRGVSGGKETTLWSGRRLSAPGDAGFWSGGGGGGVIHGLAEGRQTQSCVKILQMQLPTSMDQLFSTKNICNRSFELPPCLSVSLQSAQTPFGPR